MHATRALACAVLAAGGSARLGRPKQLVSFRGEPLVRHVARAAVARDPRAPVAVVLGAHEARIAPYLTGEGVRIVVNPAWREGLASSIRAAVAWAEGCAGLLLVLGDQPLVDADHLERLASAWRAGALASASAFGGALGAPALFDASLFGELLALRGDQGAARILRGRARAIAWPEGEVDVDTEQDVARLPW